MLAGLVLTACDAAFGGQDGPSAVEQARFQSASGPVTITTEIDGAEREIRLASIDAPDAVRARQWLDANMPDRRMTFSRKQAGEDRFGRIIADVFVDGVSGPEWVQATMVRDGAARVMSFRGETGSLPDLLDAENAARQAGLGLWQDPDYQVRGPNPDALIQFAGSVQIVSGRVMSATRLRTGRVYLNFGVDWRTDFTVRIDPGDAHRFEAAGLDPLSLEGQVVRVRGWIQDENGPMIRIDHPGRIEILEPVATVQLH